MELELFWNDNKAQDFPFCTHPHCELPAVIVDIANGEGGTFWCWFHGDMECAAEAPLWYDHPTGD